MKQEEFLEIMDDIIPWDEWVGIAETSFLHEQIELKDQKPKKRIMHLKSMYAYRYH